MVILIVLPDAEQDDGLLKRARQGSEAAMMQIYELYYPPIFGYLRLRVEDYQVAQDLASEVFTQFLEACYRQKAPERSLRGWLFRVARFTLHDYFVKVSRNPNLELDEGLGDFAEPLEHVLTRKIEMEQVRQAIRSLKADYQEVLVLRFSQMLSVQETADVMGRNPGAVRVLQVRALEQLRRRLENQVTGRNDHG